MKYPKDLNKLVKDEYGVILVCSGCAHSSALAKFPGEPSGERPCIFCLRNVFREQKQKESVELYGQELKEWYNGTPISKYPLDCYHSLDMKFEFERFKENK